MKVACHVWLNRCLLATYSYIRGRHSFRLYLLFHHFLLLPLWLLLLSFLNHNKWFLMRVLNKILVHALTHSIHKRAVRIVQCCLLVCLFVRPSVRFLSHTKKKMTHSAGRGARPGSRGVRCSCPGLCRSRPGRDCQCRWPRVLWCRRWGRCCCCRCWIGCRRVRGTCSWLVWWSCWSPCPRCGRGPWRTGPARGRPRVTPTAATPAAHAWLSLSSLLLLLLLQWSVWALGRREGDWPKEATTEPVWATRSYAFGGRHRSDTRVSASGGGGGEGDNGRALQRPHGIRVARPVSKYSFVKKYLQSVQKRAVQRKYLKCKYFVF